MPLLSPGSLNPVDVVSLVWYLEHPDASFAHTAAVLGISPSTAHASARRLVALSLIHQVGKRHVGRPAPGRGAHFDIAVDAMVEFFKYGLRYVFPAQRQGRARGVATGLAGIAQLPAIVARDEHVARFAHLSDAPVLIWPSRLGEQQGTGVVPLIPDAAELARRDPDVCVWVMIADALRTGDARERDLAHRTFDAMLKARGLKG